MIPIEILMLYGIAALLYGVMCLIDDWSEARRRRKEEAERRARLRQYLRDLR